jgi:hypothetical protein
METTYIDAMNTTATDSQLTLELDRPHPMAAPAQEPFQRALAPVPAPSQSHSETSRTAAREIEPKAGTLRGYVLAYIRGSGETGATDAEMQLALNMNPSTQRPRRIELVTAGLVIDSQTTRQTPSGRKAVVWKAAKIQN